MQRLADIDWENWQARDPATLVFVFRGDEILLINKKRGLGAGKVNGPGGKVDPGETPEQSAVREVREELRIEVSDLEYCGEHRFQFTDGYSIHVWVYRTQTFEGEPEETEEAAPLWVPIDRIPFEKMWQDDRYWLPKLIRGEKFQTRWIFDGDSMLDYDIEPDGELASWAGGRNV
jgi:8-oxo-dGTP diphosphatase